MTANSLHPGTVATGFARDGDANGFLAFGVKVIKPFILTPEKGARTSVYLASSPEVDGGHRRVLRQVPAARRPRPRPATRRLPPLLWSVSEQLVSERVSRRLTRSFGRRDPRPDRRAAVRPS